MAVLGQSLNYVLTSGHILSLIPYGIPQALPGKQGEFDSFGSRGLLAFVIGNWTRPLTRFAPLATLSPRRGQE